MREPLRVVRWATSDGQEFADKEVAQKREIRLEMYEQYDIMQKQFGGRTWFIEWILENFEPKKGVS